MKHIDEMTAHKEKELASLSISSVYRKSNSFGTAGWVLFPLYKGLLLIIISINQRKKEEMNIISLKRRTKNEPRLAVP